MAETLPELSESAAPSNVAGIYGEIRSLSGVPMVALIFRHLASRPGVLEEIWRCVAPLFRSGLLQDSAWRVASEVAGDLELPAMVAPGDMVPEVRRLLNDFGLGDRRRLDPVVPSLFRHLAQDRALLALIHVLLVPRFRDGSIEAGMRRMERAMRSESERLFRYLGPIEGNASRPDVAEVLESFTGSLIPQMIVLGFALRRSFE